MTSFAAAWRLLDDGRHRSEFYRLWRAGASAGFTVPKSMETMGPRGAPQVEQIRQAFLQATRRGETVTAAVRTGHAHFEAFEAALLLLGDESGQIERSLALLADFFARKHRLMLAVRKQMAYPLFTGMAATFIAPLPLLFFGRTGAYLILVAIGLGSWTLAGGAVVHAIAARYGGRPAMVRARLARALATAIAAGLPLGRSVRLASGAAGDDSLKRCVDAINERILSSQPVAVSLASCPHVTPEFRGVLEVAEATGDFSVVARLAELYESTPRF